MIIWLCITFQLTRMNLCGWPSIALDAHRSTLTSRPLTTAEALISDYLYFALTSQISQGEDGST